MVNDPLPQSWLISENRGTAADHSIPHCFWGFSMRQSSHLGALVCSAVVCLMSMGCGDGGPPTVKVKGKLMQGGTVVTIPQGGAAILRFYEPGGQDNAFDAEVHPDGTYEADVGKGPMEVAIQVYDVYPGPDRFNNKFQAGNTTIKVDVPGATDNLDIEIPAGM